MVATRRRFLIGAGGVVLATALPDVSAHAQSQERAAAMAAAIKSVAGENPLQQGRIKIESPMTDADHVKAIHVFTEKNPQPNVAAFQLGPRAGTANIQTRMRLADTQLVVAVAEMSDGTFWRDEVEVVVTMAACLEES
jgi:sulfur-oxidizing protein SoxY